MVFTALSFVLWVAGMAALISKVLVTSDSKMMNRNSFILRASKVGEMAIGALIYPNAMLIGRVSLLVGAICLIIPTVIFVALHSKERNLEKRKASVQGAR